MHQFWITEIVKLAPPCMIKASPSWPSKLHDQRIHFLQIIFNPSSIHLQIVQSLSKPGVKASASFFWCNVHLRRALSIVNPSTMCKPSDGTMNLSWRNFAQPEGESQSPDLFKIQISCVPFVLNLCSIYVFCFEIQICSCVLFRIQELNLRCVCFLSCFFWSFQI